MHILLIEDDSLVGGGIRTGLEVAGYTVDWSTTAEGARLAFAALASDVVVLDLGLPDEDGLALLHEWRAAGESVPVLVLTARDAVIDRITGLNAGADDYLLKPFDLDELTARVQALLRRAAGHSGPVVRHGAIVLDPVQRVVYQHGREVELTRREFTLLSKMLHARNAIVSVEQLKDSLYGLEADVESNAVNLHVHNLRRKLGADLIRTVRGLGYRLGGRQAHDDGGRS